MTAFPKVGAADLAGVAFGDWLDGRGLPDDARQLVLMLSRVATYANAPDIAAADMVVAQMQRALRDGVRYLDGGWQTIVDALLAGVRVERGTVLSVLDDAGTVRVARSDGPDVLARACVLAAGTPEAAAGLLGRQPFTVGPPVEAACLDLATSAPARPALLLGLDEPLYLSNHCPPARLAPDGVHVVHVARYLAPGESHEPRHGRAELEAHAAVAALTADVILDQRYLHRMTVVGGLAVAEHGGLRGRPTSSGVPGVFLAGDWVGPTGHLLDAVMASAEVAAAGADRAVRDATLTAR
jgi:phytoene dehydrogenase-like protein